MNLGWTEILLIGGIALLLFGPSKLPGLGRSLGESIRGFKKALNEDSKPEPEDRPSAPPQQIVQNSSEHERQVQEEKNKNRQS